MDCPRPPLGAGEVGLGERLGSAENPRLTAAFHGRRPERVSKPDSSTPELINGGESLLVEFKQSARWNERKGDKDPVLELAVLKTVAGFMNAHGGILLLGVTDDGEVVGLEADYRTIAKGGRDRYENWLTTMFETRLGKPAATRATISFETLGSDDVLPRGRGAEFDSDLHHKGQVSRSVCADQQLDSAAQHSRGGRVHRCALALMCRPGLAAPRRCVLR
jgi:hypothetical protein